MKWIANLAFLCGVFLTAPRAHAQPAAVEGSLDELIDWADPWSLTLDQFRAVADALPRKPSAQAYASSTTGNYTTVCIGGGYTGETTGGKLAMFEGQFRVEGLMAIFEGPKLTRLQFCLGQPGLSPSSDDTTLLPKSVSKEEVALIKAEIGKRSGDSKPQQKIGPKPEDKITAWKRPGYEVQTLETKLSPLQSGSQLTPTQVDVVLVDFFRPVPKASGEP